jgi:hypothetical protein
MIALTEQSFKGRDIKALIKKTEFKGYTMAILTLLTLSFFTIFAIRPALKSFFQVRKQIEDAKVVDKQLEDKINKLLKAQELYTKSSYDLALIDQALPQEPQYSEFLQRFEKIVNDSEATTTAFETTKEISLFGKITPTPETNQQPGSEIQSSDRSVPSANFHAELEAKYPQLVAMLNNLLHIRRIVTFNTISFESKNEGEKTVQSDKIDQSLDAGAHYLPDTDQTDLK